MVSAYLTFGFVCFLSLVGFLFCLSNGDEKGAWIFAVIGILSGTFTAMIAWLSMVILREFLAFFRFSAKKVEANPILLRPLVLRFIDGLRKPRLPKL